MSKRFVFLVVFVAVILALVPLGHSWDTRDTLPIVDNFTFSRNLSSNETLAVVQIPFSVIVPPHYNGSLQFKFSDMVNGTVSSRCYIAEMSVLVNTQVIVHKTFQTLAEECDIPLFFSTMGSPGNYTGILTISGSSAGNVFSGTTSLLVFFNEPSQNGGIPLVNWHGGFLDWFTLSVIIISVSSLILIVRHRRHRDD